MMTFFHSPITTKGAWGYSVFFIFISSITSACSTNPDVNDAGLLDSIYHLSKGTYQNQKQQKLQLKNKLKQRIENNQKQLQKLNQQRQEKLQQTWKLQEKLQQNKAIQKTKKKELKSIKTLCRIQKIKIASLKEELKKLTTNINKEKKKRNKEASFLLLLEQKRDKLRKEILLQTSL